MRFALPLLAALTLVVTLSACGGGDDGESAEPAALAQRVVVEEDAPGSKPDPVETGQTTVDLNEFIVVMNDLAINPDMEELTDVFTEAGFVAANLDTRFFGETHTPDAPHVNSSVIQLQSEQGAEDALEWIDNDSMKPCPMSCAVRISEFDVDGIPDARGVHRSASAEDIAARGAEGDMPFDYYSNRLHRRFIRLHGRSSRPARIRIGGSGNATSRTLSTSASAICRPDAHRARAYRRANRLRLRSSGRAGGLRDRSARARGTAVSGGRTRPRPRRTPCTSRGSRCRCRRRRPRLRARTRPRGGSAAP